VTGNREGARDAWGVVVARGSANGAPAAANAKPTADLRDSGRLPSDPHPGDDAVCAGRRVIGYVTVNCSSAGSPQAATTAIRHACERWSWYVTEIVTDRDSGCRSLERPGIGYALDQIAQGNAEGLVVGELMRLVRSQVDIASFMRWFRDQDAVLIALDLDIDTSTTDGRRIADILIALGQREQERIAERTRTALADARANGRTVGRPSISDRPGLQEDIMEMRAAGMTLQAIADRLNANGVATLRGGARWRPSSVQAALGYRRPNAPRAGGGRVRTSPEQRDGIPKPP
jgi:DNA invertase Pin-like site-specific DNA recombinase